MAIYFLILFLGLCFGSFLSVIVFRLDNKGGIMFGRSECPGCLTRLKWYDLIPLVSFFYLGGKCRYCKKKVSIIYPIMELATAGAFVSYSFFNGFFYLSNFYELAVIFVLLALLFSDYIFYILPDKLIIAGLLMSITYILFFNFSVIANGLITGLALSSFFATLYIISRGVWLGFGDVKLAFLIGFILGYPLGLWSIIISVWAGALWGIGLIIVNRANLKTSLPFGSFMAGVAILFIILKKYAFWFQF